MLWAKVVLPIALITACGSDLGRSCQQDADCGGDLVCRHPAHDGGAPALGVCTVAGAPRGQYCRSTADCEDGLLCSNQDDAALRARDGVCR